ncbi:MAG TPA: GTPase HflX, partial [Anaerolineales bacterium]|nr:GTPase HflX [Anaerolineales bacterium]
LIEAFHATLEEIIEADLLLHVVDISHPNALNQFEAVQQTLEELGAEHIPTVTALNKVDQLRDPEAAKRAVSGFPKAVTISALKGTGISELLDVVKQELYETYTPIQVKLPYQQGALISLFHEAGQVERIEHERGGVLMQGRIPGRLLAQFSGWQITAANHHEPKEEEEEL